jgi:plasmid stability protein
MTTLSIDIPDDLRAQLQTRAAEAGFNSVEQYAQALLRASAEGSLDDDALESLLLSREADPRPDVEFTPEFASRFREQVRERRASGGPQK